MVYEVKTPHTPKARRYPWNALQIGDSFFQECAYPFTNIYRLAKKQGMKVAVRKEKLGFRVERIA